MEKLANITQEDINNGVLNRMLYNAGISNVPEYVQEFQKKIEDKVVEELENCDPNGTDSDEEIASAGSVQSWINGLRLRLDDPIKPPKVESSPRTSQQQIQESTASKDLQSWIKNAAPTDLPSSNTSTTVTTTTTTSTDSNTEIPAGNLGTWLNNWSKSLAEQPPPISLDTWLQSLISQNITEPIGKANTPKGRLNTYLNAAQDVLSQHGYDVSNEVTPPTNVHANTGMFGNVKQMYFLWKTLDKNNDRKITVEDVQIMLQEMGLGFLSKYVAQTLFEMVDSNHDGALQFRDFVALMGIIKQLISAMGSTKA